jgi:hypothetical protein
MPTTTEPTSTAMKAANDNERVLLRGIIKRSTLVTKEEWTECPCGWFFIGKICPDEKCKIAPKSIKTKLYAHVDKGDAYATGRELGLKQDVCDTFSRWGYELEFEAEVNPKTGEVKLLTIDGHKIQY